ncbi:MAG: putative hydrolase [Frankiales bacterium]|nr:putative hydrolase [Frankiales bacterium]
MVDAEPVNMTSSDDVSLTGLYYAGVTGVSSGVAYLVGHRFTGSAHRPTVRAMSTGLAKSGAGVLALDFRGHGGSGGYSTVGDAETADVAAGVRWLRHRTPGVAVVTVGFSMGASVVIRQAGLHGGPDETIEMGPLDQPDAVVAVSGPGRWYERGTRPMRRVHRGLETRLGRLGLRLIFRTRVGGRWERLPLSPIELAPRLRVPLLVVHGDSDPYFGVEHARMLAASAPEADLWLEPGMGHAENATSPELLARIDRWARAAVSGSANIGR